MLATSTNEVKQYNLTQGRSLPEWLDERKRRKLLSVNQLKDSGFFFALNKEYLMHMNRDIVTATLDYLIGGIIFIASIPILII
jgi:hypothetical protein